MSPRGRFPVAGPALLGVGLLVLAAGTAGTGESTAGKPDGGGEKIVLRVQGRLKAADPVARGAHFKVHEVSLEAGVYYRIDLIGAGKLDAFLRLENAAGKLLDDDDDSGGGLNARLVFRPAAGGRYRLVATTYAQGATGAYQLLVAEVDERAEKLWRSDRLRGAAQAAYRQGKDAEAIALTEKMLALDRELRGPDHPAVVSALRFLAAMREQRAEFPAARTARTEVLAIRTRQHGAGSWQAADARLDLQHTDLLQRLTAEQRARLREADAFMAKARADGQPGAYASRVALARKALQIRRDILGPEHRLVADSANWTGFLLNALGDRAAARECLEQALAIDKKVLAPDHPDLGGSFNNLGRMLHDLGDGPAARRCYEQALALFRKVLPPDHPHLLHALDHLGSVLRDLEDLPAARQCHEQALAIRQKALPPDHPDLARSLTHLGRVLQDLGDRAGARKYYERALAVRQKALPPDHPELAASLTNLGSVLPRPVARKYYEQTLAIEEKVLPPDHPELARSLNNLGRVLLDLGDRPAARRHFERALAIWQKALPPDHTDVALALNNLGFALHALGERRAARKHHEQALAIWQKVLPPNHSRLAISLNNLGLVLHDLGDHSAARKCYERALLIAQGNLELAAAAQSERVQLARAAELRFFLDALLCLPAAADDSAVYARVLAWKGAVFTRQRRQRLLRHAQDDPALRRDFLRLEEVCRRLATLALGDPGKVRLAERLAELERLTGEKERLEERLSARSQAFGREKQRARLTPPALASALPAETALVDFLEYQRREVTGKGPPRSERRLLAFIVRPGRPVTRVELGEAGAIAERVDGWRKVLLGARAIRKDTHAAELRKAIWRPLEKHLEGAKRVLLSPDGPLTRLPFAALPGSKPGTFLLEERALAVVPVPQWLPELLAASGEPAPPSLLAIGDVDYGAPPGKPAEASSPRAGALAEWAPLSGTGREVAAVHLAFQRRFKGGRAEVLQEEQATEGAFRAEAPKYRWLHIATHGFFAPPSLRSALSLEGKGRERLGGPSLFEGGSVEGFHPGLLSGLVLAGANSEAKPGHDDGILTALEVAALDLSRTEMAVLSACETGLGATAGGEGLLGLQRAFQVAGARTVVASLWQVDDKGTEVLMARLYKNLWGKKGLGKLEALREAQLWMLREGRQSLRGIIRVDEAGGPRDERLPPRYWAAFVLSGDWR
jgi:CHAT domain-containing protein/tetratricopeptide (TPR) repeat protein